MCVHICVCMSVYVHVCVRVRVCVFCCTIQNHTLKAITSITWGVLDPCDIDTVVQVLAVKWDSSNSEEKNQDQSSFQILILIYQSCLENKNKEPESRKHTCQHDLHSNNRPSVPVLFSCVFQEKFTREMWDKGCK